VRLLEAKGERTEADRAEGSSKGWTGSGIAKAFGDRAHQTFTDLDSLEATVRRRRLEFGPGAEALSISRIFHDIRAARHFHS
jgi:hypothetical protein